MEDSEYPSWLWDILKPKAKAEDDNLAADLYCKIFPSPNLVLPQRRRVHTAIDSGHLECLCAFLNLTVSHSPSFYPSTTQKLTLPPAKSKAKRTAAKKALKAGKINLSASQKIPIYEQSLDLPIGDGTPEGAIEAAKARKELTKAMREKRRSSIKETNFLKTMS